MKNLSTKYLFLLANAVLITRAFSANAESGAPGQNPSQRTVPSTTQCRELLANNKVMLTSFFVPFQSNGKQTTLSIKRTIGELSKNPNDPASPEDPVSSVETVFDYTAEISHINSNGVAYLLPKGFVNFELARGEVAFALPEGPEIAFIAVGCVFPEPGVVIGN